MIEASNAVSYADTRITAPEGRKVLRMVTNERTAGSIPSWENPGTERQRVEQSLAMAGNGGQPSFESTLAYQQNIDQPAKASREFGFGDLFDMINPLQHIPVVSHFYRSFTGDEIRPIGRIIGGAVYGGALGAATNLVNVIIEEETGKDIAGNAIALAFNGDTPTLRSAPKDSSPEERLDTAAQIAKSNTPSYTDLTGMLLAFSETDANNIVIERVEAASGRTAGTMAQAARTYASVQETMGNLPAREPITQVMMRSMPRDIY